MLRDNNSNKNINLTHEAQIGDGSRIDFLSIGQWSRSNENDNYNEYPLQLSDSFPRFHLSTYLIPGNAKGYLENFFSVNKVIGLVHILTSES